MNHEQTNAKTLWILRAARLLTTGLVIGLFARNVTAEQAHDPTAARLQAVEDRLAIEQLLLGDYSKALDSQNWKAFSALFTDDGEVRVESDPTAPKVFKGHAEVERAFSGPPPAPPAGAAGGPPPGDAGAQMVSMKHVITNFSVELHGDQATARAYWMVVLTTKDGRALVGVSGRYNDTFKRDNGRWKFYRKVITDVPEGGAMPGMPATGATPGAPPAQR